MNSQNTFREDIEKAEKMRKSSRLKLRINILFFFVVYGGGIPLASHLWDTNRTVFYVVVIYMMLNIFLQGYVYFRVTNAYSTFIETKLLDKLLAMKFPEISFEPDVDHVENCLKESSLFWGRPPVGIECSSRFHGEVDGLKFDLARFTHMGSYLDGTYATVTNSQPSESTVYIVKRGTKLLSGIGESLKDLPGVKSMLPDIPEQKGVIPELEEVYYIYSESPDSIKTAFTPERLKLLLELAEERSKLMIVSLSFIGDQIHHYDSAPEWFSDLPSLKHKLTESSPDIVFKGLLERIKFLKRLASIS